METGTNSTALKPMCPAGFHPATASDHMQGGKFNPERGAGWIEAGDGVSCVPDAAPAAAAGGAAPPAPPSIGAPAAAPVAPDDTPSMAALGGARSADPGGASLLYSPDALRQTIGARRPPPLANSLAGLKRVY